VTRADFLADRTKPFASTRKLAGVRTVLPDVTGSAANEELPAGWGLLECQRGRVQMLHPSSTKSLRSAEA